MRFLGGMIVALCLLGGAAQANEADVRRQASEHFQKGKTAYELGHYDLAVSEYEAAYQLVNEPTLLFNLGQAHRFAGHAETALHFYKMYLSKVPDSPARAEVEAHIATLTTAIEADRKAKADAAAAAAARAAEAQRLQHETATPSTTEKPTTEPAAVVVAPAVDTQAARRARTMKIAGIAVGVGGVALAGVGIAFGVLAKGAADSISHANAAHQPYDPAKYTTYQNDLVASGVLIGVGAAAAVTGTVLAIIGMRRGKSAAMALAPSISPTHAGLSAAVRF